MFTKAQSLRDSLFRSTSEIGRHGVFKKFIFVSASVSTISKIELLLFARPMFYKMFEKTVFVTDDEIPVFDWSKIKSSNETIF